MSDFQDLLRAGAARKYDDETLKRELLRLFETTRESFVRGVVSMIQSKIIDRQKLELNTKGTLLKLTGDAVMGHEEPYEFSIGHLYSMMICSDDSAGELLAEAYKIADRKILSECISETGLNCSYSAAGTMGQRSGGWYHYPRDTWNFYFSGRWFDVEKIRKTEIQKRRVLLFKRKIETERVEHIYSFSKVAKHFLSCLRDVAYEEGIELGMQYSYKRFDDSDSDVERIPVLGGWDVDFLFSLPNRTGDFGVEITYSLKL